MNPTNKQELIETILSILGIVDRTSGNRPEQIATLEQELTAHTNAEIARVLGRIEETKPENYWLAGTDLYHGFEEALKDYTIAIQAERAKLKEVK